MSRETRVGLIRYASLTRIRHFISEMARMRSAWEFIKTLHLEPILFIFSVTIVSYNSASNTLMTQKICFPDGPPGVSVVCTNPERLKKVADVFQVKNSLREWLPAVVVIIAGSWRDVTRRNLPLFIMAHIGEMVATTIDLISCLQWNISPMMTGVFSSVAGALGGSRSTITMACLAYITECSTEEERAMRMPALMIAMMGGMCISMLLSGYLLTQLGYEIFFAVMLVLYGISFCLAIFLIRDKKTEGHNGSFCETLMRLKIIFRWRPNSFHIWLLILATSILTSMITAEGTVSSLFLQGKFHFAPTQIGLFTGIKMAISLISAALAMPLFKKLFKLSEFNIVAICFIPSIISVIGLPFAENLAELYVFSTFDLLRIVLIATLIHLFTGLLKKSEVGIFTSFLSFSEGVLPVGLNPLYAKVYKLTISVMPGAFYFISGGTLVLSGILIWIISYSYEPYTETEEEEPVAIKVAKITSRDDI